MEAIVARAIQVVVALSGAYLVALWFVLVVWTYRDIEGRSRNVLTQVFSTLLVVLFYIPGVLLYLILRPKETLDVAFQRSLEEEYLLQDLEELPLCQSCQRYVEDDFILCPHCHATLRQPCHACDRLVHLKWSLCPYCGVEQSKKAAIERERVVRPAARWSQPVRKRRTLGPSAPRLLPRPAEAPAAAEPAAAAMAATAPVVEPVAAAVAPLEPVAAAVAEPAPIRLFDRRNTRAAGRRNGTAQLTALKANGTNGNGAHAKANGNGHHTDEREWLARLASANGHHGANGHHKNGLNGIEPIERNGAMPGTTREAEPEEVLERVPAHLARERD